MATSDASDAAAQSGGTPPATTAGGSGPGAPAPVPASGNAPAAAAAPVMGAAAAAPVGGPAPAAANQPPAVGAAVVQAAGGIPGLQAPGAGPNPTYQSFFAGQPPAGPATMAAVRDSLGAGNARGHVQCMSAAIASGRYATTFAYLGFTDRTGSVASAIFIAPQKYNDLPGTAATGFDDAVLVQVGDVAYSARGDRRQVECAVASDIFERLGNIRVPTAAEYDALVQGNADFTNGIAPIAAGDAGDDLRVRCLTPIPPGLAAVLLGESGGEVAPDRFLILLDAYETAQGAAEVQARDLARAALMRTAGGDRPTVIDSATLRMTPGVPTTFVDLRDTVVSRDLGGAAVATAAAQPAAAATVNFGAGSAAVLGQALAHGLQSYRSGPATTSPKTLVDVLDPAYISAAARLGHFAGAAERLKGPAGASLPMPQSHASNRSRTATVAKFAGEEHVLSDELGECIQDDLRLYRSHGWRGLVSRRRGRNPIAASAVSGGFNHVM